MCSREFFAAEQGTLFIHLDHLEDMVHTYTTLLSASLILLSSQHCPSELVSHSQHIHTQKHTHTLSLSDLRVEYGIQRVTIPPWR